MTQDNPNLDLDKLAFGYAVISHFVLAHLIDQAGVREQIKHILKSPGVLIDTEPVDLRKEIQEAKLNLIAVIDSIPADKA